MILSTGIMETNTSTEQNKACSRHAKQTESKNSYTRATWAFHISPNSWCRHSMSNCCFLQNLPYNFIISSDMHPSQHTHPYTSCVLPLGRRKAANEAGFSSDLFDDQKSWLYNPNPAPPRFSEGAPVFSTRTHSSRNCPQKPLWSQRCQCLLATKDCWFFCLRFRTSVSVCRTVASGTPRSFWKLSSSQNRDSLFREGKSWLFVSAMDAKKKKKNQLFAYLVSKRA